MRMPWPLYHFFTSPSRFTTDEPGLLARRQRALGVQEAEELDAFGHDSGPAGLVAGTQVPDPAPRLVRHSNLP